MTTVRLLKEPVPYKRTPQCEMEINEIKRLVDAKWREKRFGPRGTNVDNCQRPSVVELDGKYYCRLHAGHIALSILLRNQDGSF